MVVAVASKSGPGAIGAIWACAVETSLLVRQETDCEVAGVAVGSG